MRALIIWSMALLASCATLAVHVDPQLEPGGHGWTSPRMCSDACRSPDGVARI